MSVVFRMLETSELAQKIVQKGSRTACRAWIVRNLHHGPWTVRVPGVQKVEVSTQQSPPRLGIRSLHDFESLQIILLSCPGANAWLLIDGKIWVKPGHLSHLCYMLWSVWHETCLEWPLIAIGTLRCCLSSSRARIPVSVPGPVPALGRYSTDTIPYQHGQPAYPIFFILCRIDKIF